ncbi:hypothetical protein NUSPORA_00112 [Nucleospora cyclopteri]
MEDLNNFIATHFQLQTNTNEGVFYIPNSPGNNSYRHFGLKIANKVLFSKTEVVYLYLKEKYKNEICNLPEIRQILQKEQIVNIKFEIYCNLKAKDFNILQEGSCLQLYNKNSDFNRNKNVPIAKFCINSCYNKFNFNLQGIFVVGIYENVDFTFIKINQIDKLSKDTPLNLYKNNGNSKTN